MNRLADVLVVVAFTVMAVAMIAVSVFLTTAILSAFMSVANADEADRRLYNTRGFGLPMPFCVSSFYESEPDHITRAGMTITDTRIRIDEPTLFIGECDIDDPTGATPDAILQVICQPGLTTRSM